MSIRNPESLQRVVTHPVDRARTWVWYTLCTLGMLNQHLLSSELVGLLELNLILVWRKVAHVAWLAAGSG